MRFERDIPPQAAARRLPSLPFCTCSHERSLPSVVDEAPAREPLDAIRASQISGVIKYLRKTDKRPASAASKRSHTRRAREMCIAVSIARALGVRGLLLPHAQRAAPCRAGHGGGGAQRHVRAAEGRRRHHDPPRLCHSGMQRCHDASPGNPASHLCPVCAWQRTACVCLCSPPFGRPPLRFTFRSAYRCSDAASAVGTHLMMQIMNANRICKE